MSEQAIEVSLPARRVTPALGDLSFGMRLQKIGLNVTLLAGLILLTVGFGMGTPAPLLTPYDPIAQKLDEAFKPPLSPNHILGTDNFGRDMWSRIVYSTRLDLQIVLFSILFPFIFGCATGVATGYLGGRLDTLFMRVVDVLMAFPFLILVVAIMTVLGPGLVNLYIAFGLVGWIPYACITRGETLATRNLEYIQAA